MDFILFFTVVIGGFALLLVSLRMGIEYTLSYYALLGALMAFTLTYPLEIWGWSILLAEAFYASFFLGTDIITDHFGKKEAKKMVWSMLSGLVVAILLGKIIILMDTGDLSGALSGFFDPLSMWSLILVVFIIFLEQRIDIIMFGKIKDYTSGKYLWLRNCVSTITVQTLDVIIVYPLFFYPIFGTEVWKLMVAAAALKIVIAFMDTPLVYLSKRILR